MIDLTIDDKNYSLPSEWSEITLRQFIDTLILKKDVHNSNLDSFIKTLAILANDSSLEDVLFNIDVEQFNIIKDAFVWIQEEPEQFSEPKDFFEFEGKKFTMKKDYKNLTVGEAITVELLMQDKSFDLEPLEISFAVLFREIGENGKMKEFNADTMFQLLGDYSKRIRIVDVYEVISFFLRGEKNSSSKNTKVSLSIQVKK